MRALLVLVLLAPALAGCAAPAPAAVVDGFDPAVPHCVGACARIVDDSAARAWEPFIAADPNDPDRIVVVHSDSPSSTGEGQTRVSVSDDGGTSWETSVVFGDRDEAPDHPLAPYAHVGWFPTLVFLPDGTVVLSAIATNIVIVEGERIRSMQTLYTARSADGGRGWGDIRIVDQGLGVSVGASGQGRQANEARMTPGADGTLLLVWSQVTHLHPDSGISRQDGRLVFSSSDDGGLTWPGARVVDDRRGYAPQPVVGRDGVWRVVYLESGNNVLHFSESHDRGQTWNARSLGEHAGGLRPAMQAQTLASGLERLLLAYPTVKDDGSLGIIEFTWSDDGGATWSLPVVIHAPEYEGESMPSVVGGPGDSAWITFFDIRSPDSGRSSTYVATKVVDGIAGEPLVLDEMDEVPLAFDGGLPAAFYMGLSAAPGGDALAAWISITEGEHDVAWARVTGGDAPLSRLYARAAIPTGLAEPVLDSFVGHVNVPYYCASPARHPAVDDATFDQHSALFEFEVPNGTRAVSGSLMWATDAPVGTRGLDFEFYDAAGDYRGGAYGSVNPDTVEIELRYGDAGTWTAWVYNCQNPPTDFTLEVTLS